MESYLWPFFCALSVCVRFSSNLFVCMNRGRSQEGQQISAKSPLAGQQRDSDPPPSPSPSHGRIPPTETAGTIDLLKNKEYGCWH